MKRKTISFLITCSVVMSLIIEPFFWVAQAFVGGSIDIPSPSEAAAEIEKRYHLNLESIQEYGEGFNVSLHKTVPPEVRVFFNPSDPTPGKEVRARAYPQFFANDNEDLYYTWYLKREGCGTKDDVDNNRADFNCDYNLDDNYDEEDWKIEAMRIIVNARFEYEDAIARGVYQGDSNDGDGYGATYGGRSRKRFGEDNYCYIHDWEDGLNYELVKTLRFDSSGDCDGEVVCLFDEQVVCQVGHISTYYVCREEPNAIPECEQGQLTCPEGKAYCLNGNYTCNPNYQSCFDHPDDIADLSCYSLDGLVTSGDELRCDTQFSTYLGEQATSCQGGIGFGYEANLCQHLFPLSKTIDRDDSGRIEVRDEPSDYYSREFKDTYGEFETGDKKFAADEEFFWWTDPNDPDTANYGPGDEANLVGVGRQDFKWLYQKGDEVGVVVEGISTVPTKHDDQSWMLMWALPKNDCRVTGKGVYTKRIKGYTVEIPTAEMTINECLAANLLDPREGAQAGNMEVGLRYSPDHPVNDPEDDQAALNEIREKCESGEYPPDYWQCNDQALGLGTDGSTGDKLIIRSSVDNSTNTGVHVVYTWSISVSPDGTYNPRAFNIKDTDNESVTGGSGWVDITQTLEDYQLINHSIGNNLQSLPIKLNITDALLEEVGLTYEDVFGSGIGHMRVKLRVDEYYDFDKISRTGRAEAIIKITSTGKRIEPFGYFNNDPAGVQICQKDEEGNIITCEPCGENENDDTCVAPADDLTLYLDNALASPICEGSFTKEKNICFIAQNELIGVRVNETLENYSWKINGEPLMCDRKISANCSDTVQTNINYFPVSGSAGDYITITVAGILVKETSDPEQGGENGKFIELSRVFEIVEPYVTIDPIDGTTWKKYLGYYTNEEGEKFDHDSETIFQTYPGATDGTSIITLSAFIHPDFLKNKSKMQWYLDTQLQAITSPPNEFSFSNTKWIGDAYQVDFEMIYLPDILSRKAMNQIWDVSMYDLDDTYISHSVKVEVVGSGEYESDYARNGKPRTLFASVLHNAPEQFLYALQLVLSVLVVIGGLSFFSQLLFGRRNEND